MFEYKILKKDKNSKARLGEFSTPHGKLLTPELAFVATEGEIKCIPKEILPKLPAKLIIVNAFHIWVKDILKKINDFSDDRLQSSNKNKKTIHDYAHFRKPVMSDSGGFQIFSMGFGKAHGVGKIASMFPGENRARQIFFESQLFEQRSDEVKLRIPKMNKERLVPTLVGMRVDLEKKISSSDVNNPLKIIEQGVEFIFNDKKILFTPEKSMEIQRKIGADIMFAFDECTSPLNSKEYTREAMKRTHRWLERCIKTKSTLDARNWKLDKQALFAIVQGGCFKDLRKQSAQYMAKLDVSGFGIGGSLGTTEDEVRDVLEWIIPYLPDEKPRHLLGIGKVKDIFDSVERGIDLFDCVIPTREARHKVIYTKKGKFQVRKMKHYCVSIDSSCQCIACQEKITWKHLTEFFSQKDPRAFFFATVHNIQFFADLMKKIREAIKLNKFNELKEEILKYY